MFRRRRPLLRAAVVGGGAYMAGKSHARHSMEQQQYQDEQDGRISNLEQQQGGDQQQGGYQQAPPPAPPPAPAQPSPMIDQLNQLAALHQQGVLTDDEFAAAKAKLIGYLSPTGRCPAPSIAGWCRASSLLSRVSGIRRQR